MTSSPPHPGSPPAIECRDLTKRYGGTEALAGLTMSVGRGEVFGFLGPNGAGKTTAVKLLVGLTRPTSGSARLLDRPAGDLEARRRLGYLPELFRYQGWMTAREVLTLHCELARIERRRWAAEVDSALALVGLADRAGGRVETYSKGMQQRLGLGVALLGSPDLVLLDEPTSALDPIGRADVRAIIGHLRERGVTVFLNSHLLGEVERVCDRVAIIDHGRVVAEMGMAEMLDDRSVRVRLTGLPVEALAGLERFGRLEPDGEWLTVSGIDDATVPELVDAIVHSGGRVHAVLPGHRSLEDRFLSLVAGDENGAATADGAD
jgi:ABC-2 type transport system ATP-binding protein